MGGCSEKSSIVTARIHQPVQTDLGAHCDTIVSCTNVAFQKLCKSVLETICFKLTQQQWWVQGVARLQWKECSQQDSCPLPSSMPQPG